MKTKIDSAVKSGCKYNGKTYSACYASRLEGKRNPGKNPQYRAEIVPLHSGDKPQYTFGASCSKYVEMDKELKANGYQQINLQWYTDKQSRMRFQSAWIKINH